MVDGGCVLSCVVGKDRIGSRVPTHSSVPAVSINQVSATVGGVEIIPRLDSTLASRSIRTDQGPHSALHPHPYPHSHYPRSLSQCRTSRQVPSNPPNHVRAPRYGVTNDGAPRTDGWRFIYNHHLSHVRTRRLALADTTPLSIDLQRVRVTAFVSRVDDGRMIPRLATPCNTLQHRTGS